MKTELNSSGLYDLACDVIPDKLKETNLVSSGHFFGILKILL